MRYIATRKTFTRINETSGTLQNTSKICDVEVSNEAVENTGIILSPQDKFSFSNATLYVRCVGGGGAEIRVVPFIIGGVATPNTDEPVTPAEDVWRYENAGNIPDESSYSGDVFMEDDLTETQSRTGMAFAPTVAGFILPRSLTYIPEIWIKFDVYCRVDAEEYNTQIRWAVELSNSSGCIFDVLYEADNTGADEYARYSIEHGDKGDITDFKLHRLQTVLIHITANDSNETFEIWVDEEKVGDYHGTVRNDDSSATLNFMGTGDSRVLFSNIIVSNAEIDFDEIVSTTPTPSDPIPSDPTTDNDVDSLIADALNGDYTSDPDADSVIDDMLNNTDPIDTGDGFSDFINDLFP